MYMVTSQLLADAILVDVSQALVHDMGPHSRNPSIDAHVENVSSTQESSITQLSTQYPNKLKIKKSNMNVYPFANSHTNFQHCTVVAYK